jgi:hypothetical protein
MSTTNIEAQQQIKQTLALKRALDQRLNGLVEKACGRVDACAVADSNSKLERSQFDNVLAVATESGSVEVVKNFIRYQIGRKDGEGWRHGSFGLGVVEDIDKLLLPQAKELAQTTQVAKDVVWMDLLRLYVGYMRRHWVFRRWEKKGEAV